jgi:hypothetical protein
MRDCRKEIPESQFIEPQKLGSGPGFLKNTIQFGRMQLKEEGSNGFSRVIWEISDKMKKTLIGLFLLFSSICFSATYSYDSHCIIPKFSPDERYVAFWDKGKSPFEGWLNILKLYDIKADKKIVVLERNFNPALIKGVCYEENVTEFEQLSWSPNGRYIGFALMASQFEIYDIVKKKLVAELDIGQVFEIKWLNNESIQVGYISFESNPNDWTEDTYAIVQLTDGAFKIKEKILPGDAEIYKHYGEFTEFELQTIKLDLTLKNKVEKVKFEKNDDGISDDSLDDETFDDSLKEARENSQERHVLSISKYAKYAIIANNYDLYNDDFSNSNQLKVELIKIPKRLRQEIVIFLQKENTPYK